MSQPKQHYEISKLYTVKEDQFKTTELSRWPSTELKLKQFKVTASERQREGKGRNPHFIITLSIYFVFPVFMYFPDAFLFQFENKSRSAAYHISSQTHTCEL